MSFPISDSTPPASEQESPAYAARSATVLLVDDEQAVLQIVKLMLERAGHEVAAFVSAIAALAEFEKRPEAFDIVLSDQTMPEMTGTELARTIRAMRPDLPIALMTGFSSSELPAEIDHLVHKPIKVGELAAIINGLLHRGAKSKATAENENLD